MALDAPFPFLGHSTTPTAALHLWLVLADPTASAEELREPLALLGPVRALRFDGPVAEVRVKGLTPPGRRDDVLRAVHAATPLGLVVQVTGTNLSAWHRASALDARKVLDALEPVARAAPGPYCAPRPFSVRWRSDEVSKTLLRSLRGHAPRAKLVQVALSRLWKTTRGDARDVLGDYLLERLPPLLGHDFDVDLVLREQLALVQGLSPASLPMSSAFQEGLAQRLRHAPHRDASADAGPLQTAITAKDAKAAARLLRDDDPAHVRLLLGLDEAQLRWLAEHGCATQLANAGVREVARGAFREALRLYDAALFAPELDARACANPLYAVQDDNNHLGVDEARARRYLERCLPHGQANPTIFLNAAFVFMELGEPDAALDALAKAKAGGIDVKAQRNEALLAPLRTRREFQALVR